MRTNILKKCIPLILLMMLVISGCEGKVQITYGTSGEGDNISNNSSDKFKEKTATVSFDSFDGGGPSFDVLIADESIVSYDSERKYHKADHEEMNGAGYDVIITFTGKKPGETTVVIEERSPIADNLDHEYKIVVDDSLKVQLTKLSVKEINEVGL